MGKRFGREEAARNGAPEPQDQYASPLATRYASRRMRELFSERARIRCWRELWVTLAETQRELGLEVPARPLATLRRRIDEIDFAAAAEYENRFRHDVMAHLHAFADLCPEARPWLHLGATSCFITDNADLLLIRRGLGYLQEALVGVIEGLRDFARRYQKLPTLGYTHFQPAQPTTVGKRACLWIQDLLLDLEEVVRFAQWLPLRGAKGTTGTQASFLSLFDGDHARVKQLDRRIAEKLGFEKTFPVTGQTYPRKVDSRLLAILSGIAQSAAKAANDVRLLSHEQEVEEPYETQQVGSSAMAYKRNPMRSERMGSLARFVVHLAANGPDTAAQQWLERTLDDSANRRLVLAEAFLGIDAVLRIYHSIATRLLVNEAVVRANLERELPFLCTEEILMHATRAGGDRQELHERIRVHSRAAAERLKSGAHDNDLFERLEQDPAFAAIHGELRRLRSGKALVGRAPEQVSDFLRSHVEPALRKWGGGKRGKVEDLSV